jgi:hypothetical protein
MLRAVITIVFFYLFYNLALGQAEYIPLQNSVSYFIESEQTDSFISHSSVKPFLLSKQTNSYQKFLQAGLLSSKDSSNEGNYISISPYINISPGYQLQPASAYFMETSGGGILNMQYKEKLFANAVYYYGLNTLPSYLQSYTDSFHILPSEGYASASKRGYINQNFNGYISYSPSSVFNFQDGRGKNFWGNGYRSLLLSDAANNYPYLKITTTVWKIKYVNLFANFKDIRAADTRNYSSFQNKYGAFHYLSWAATKRLNISFFESVIWMGKDTLVNRNFDVNYLNPVIFYRPVEYAVGSADNSLMGLNISYNATKSFQLYGQLLLDEFLLDSVKARNGWWANKQAAQAGFKLFNFAGIKGLGVQLEYNYVRPYTYSHGNPLQNYGHFNQSLAHPMGANFREAVFFIRYNRNRWFAELQMLQAQMGKDSSGKNFGGDIYKSYNKIVRISGNYTTQGLKTDLLFGSFRLSYLLYSPSNLRAEFMLAYRESKNIVRSEKNLFFSFGVRTSLWNVYRDFM